MKKLTFLWESAYPFYLLIALVVVAWIIATPILAHSQSPLAPSLYDAGKYICHQKISRSFCLFFEPGLRVGDCTPQNGELRNDLRSEWCADGKGDVRENCAGLQEYGYKFPVSARDITVYIGALIGAVAFAFMRGMKDTRVPHWIWLALALVPMGIDGTTQLFGLRESNNMLRAITGLIVGIAISFYFIPMMNSIVMVTKREAEERKVLDKFKGWKTLAFYLLVAAAVFVAMMVWMHPEFFQAVS